MAIKEIEGFEGYFVSDEGDVFSGTGASRKKLNPWPIKAGYLKIDLHPKTGRKKKYVPRLVAQAFLPNPDDKEQVNHKNGDKTDNRIENLEWNTASENNTHAYRELGRKAHWTGKFGVENPTSKAVIQMDLEGNEVERFGSTMEACRAGFDNSNISSCCNGRRKTHRGFKWKFA